MNKEEQMGLPMPMDFVVWAAFFCIGWGMSKDWHLVE